MAEVQVDNLEYNYAIESTQGTQPTSGWRALYLNEVGRFEQVKGTTEQDYMSKDRSQGPGEVTSVESAIEIETDFSRSVTRDFIESFIMSSFQGGLVAQATAAVDQGVSDDEFTVASGGDLDANRLVYTRGFENDANNGVFVVQSGSTSTTILVPTASLVDESSPPDNAEVAVCGHQGADGDLEIDSDGNLISTSLDFTTLPLTVGQTIKFPDAGTTYAFVLSGNEGYARITKIEQNKITLDKKGQSFQADDGTDTGSGGTAKAIRIFFGSFVRNVDRDHSDFLRQSLHFEEVLANLGSGGATRYRYSKGNYANQMQINAPLEDKATVNFSFLGIGTDAPTSSRATGASDAIQPNAHRMFGTPSNIPRLRLQKVDETGLSTDFKNCNITLNNRLSTEEVVGQLEAKYVNYRKIEAMAEGEVILTSEDLLTALSDHEDVTFDQIYKNDEGAVAIDFPAAKASTDGANRPRGEAMKVPLTIRAHKDPILGYSVGISTFPYVE